MKKNKIILIGLIFISFLFVACEKTKLSEENELEKSTEIITADINELAKESYIKTFKKNADNVRVISIKVEEYDEVRTILYTYVDENNNESTFMSVKNKNELKGGGYFIVDCTGDPCCRERYLPETGAIECTCDGCAMEIIKME